MAPFVRPSAGLSFVKLMVPSMRQLMAAMGELQPAQRDLWAWLAQQHKRGSWCVELSQEAIAEAYGKSPGMVRKAMMRMRAVGLAKAYTTKAGHKAVMLNPEYVRFTAGGTRAEAYHLRLWDSLPLTGGQEKIALRLWEKNGLAHVED